MYAYLFEGYWKDVGTVTSLWEANMDLLGENPLINLNETSFRIYSRNLALPPTYIGTGGKVLNSIMTAGCEINGKVVNSVLGEGVTVEKGAEIYDSVVMRGTRVRKGAVLRYGMIDENCDIGEDCRIGRRDVGQIQNRARRPRQPSFRRHRRAPGRDRRTGGEQMKVVGIVFSNIHDKGVHELTASRTLASVPFAGRFRLIDFVLSNMVNSGITKVGVITKQNYQSLMDHVGSGKYWDLSRKNGGLMVLPPFGADAGSVLYSSRFEALTNIVQFIRRCDEDYVVLSDCDIICNIDFADVVQKHIDNHADITLVYRRQESAGRDRIAVALDRHGRVTAMTPGG